MIFGDNSRVDALLQEKYGAELYSELFGGGSDYTLPTSQENQETQPVVLKDIYGKEVTFLIPVSSEVPTKDKGGFVDKNKFYNYMLDQAKNNPVEVAAFALVKNGETSYFVLPWDKNDRTTTMFTTIVSYYGLNGYRESDISQFYHTHPDCYGPSKVDREWSNNSLIPIWVICPNGVSYVYSPLDVETNSIDLNYFLSF